MALSPTTLTKFEVFMKQYRRHALQWLWSIILFSSELEYFLLGPGLNKEKSFVKVNIHILILFISAVLCQNTISHGIIIF